MMGSPGLDDGCRNFAKTEGTQVGAHCEDGGEIFGRFFGLLLVILFVGIAVG